MIARGKTLGALTLATDQSGRRFDEHDLELAEELARRCAHGGGQRPPLLGAGLHRSDAAAEPAARRAARTSRASRPPRASGRPARATRWAATSTTCSRPATAAGRVVMGDVCGKGPDAAAVTALARYTLRAAAMRERLPEPQPRTAERGPAAPARRPPLLHRRLRLPRADGRRRADRVRQRRASAAAAAARRRDRRGGGRARHAARGRSRPELRGPRRCPLRPATRSSSTPTG